MRTLLSSLLLLLLLATPLAWSNSAPHPRPADWATPLDARLNLYRMDQGLYRSALPQAGDLAGIAVGEDARSGHDGGVLRMVQRHLDHIDRIERRLRVGRRLAVGADR